MYLQWCSGGVAGVRCEDGPLPPQIQIWKLSLRAAAVQVNRWEFFCPLLSLLYMITSDSPSSPFQLLLLPPCATDCTCNPPLTAVLTPGQSRVSSCSPSVDLCNWFIHLCRVQSRQPFQYLVSWWAQTSTSAFMAILCPRRERNYGLLCRISQ